MHVSTTKRDRGMKATILAAMATFIAGIFLTAAPAGASQPSTVSSSVDMSASMAGAVSQVTNATLVTATTAYPTSSSVCGTTTVFGRLCARAVEGASGVEWDYGVFYEAANRPKVRSAVMTVQMCGYGTGGSCRYLGSTYTQTFNIISSFGRGCSYIVGGGWSFAAAGCQQNGENYDLNEGWLYKAHVVLKLVRDSDGQPFTYVADSGWISPVS